MCMDTLHKGDNDDDDYDDDDDDDDKKKKKEKWLTECLNIRFLKHYTI